MSHKDNISQYDHKAIGYRLNKTFHGVVCECQLTPYKIKRHQLYLYNVGQRIAANDILLVKTNTERIFRRLSLFKTIWENFISVEKIFKCKSVCGSTEERISKTY